MRPDGVVPTGDGVITTGGEGFAAVAGLDLRLIDFVLLFATVTDFPFLGWLWAISGIVERNKIAAMKANMNFMVILRFGK